MRSLFFGERPRAVMAWQVDADEGSVRGDKSQRAQKTGSGSRSARIATHCAVHWPIPGRDASSRRTRAGSMPPSTDIGFEANAPANARRLSARRRGKPMAAISSAEAFDTSWAVGKAWVKFASSEPSLAPKRFASLPASVDAGAAGRPFGPAKKARAKAGLLGLRGRSEKRVSLPPRHARGTDDAAVNARRRDADVESPVEARIPRRHRLVAKVVV